MGENLAKRLKKACFGVKMQEILASAILESKKYRVPRGRYLCFSLARRVVPNVLYNGQYPLGYRLYDS
ncbi:MAG: hypothetical protein DRI71_10130 [Bacteroidetes bacterium]|nr:MAG: hypothetical protein DRI71_10130 [Bacteroidota bacterium]